MTSGDAPIFSRLPGEEGLLAADEAYVTALVAEVRDCGYGRRDPESWALLTAHRTEAFRAIAVPIMVVRDIQAALNVVWIQEAYADKEVEQSFYQRLKTAAEELGELSESQRLY